MALKAIAVLALLAVGARAQIFGDHPELDQKLQKTFTTVDCLLGKPNCPSPPPPPSPSPPPPPTPSPTTIPTPVATPPVVVPPALPPVAPGSATLTIDVNTPTPLTPAQKDELAALLSARLGVNVVVVNVVAGRKLLAPEVETYSVTNIKDCPTTEQQLLAYVNSPAFVMDANDAAIPVPITSSEVLTFICGGAGSAFYTKPLPPVPGPTPLPTVPGPAPLPTGPALAPGPLAAEAMATSIVGFYNSGPPLDANGQQAVANTVAGIIGPGVTATVAPAAGRRHLLAQQEGFTIIFMNVPDCAIALQNIQNAITDGSLERKFQAAGPPLSNLSNFQLGSFACVDESKPNQPPTNYVNADFVPIPPTTAPPSGTPVSTTPSGTPVSTTPSETPMAPTSETPLAPTSE